jgi:hypothetical protein
MIVSIFSQKHILEPELKVAKINLIKTRNATEQYQLEKYVAPRVITFSE